MKNHKYSIIINIKLNALTGDKSLGIFGENDTMSYLQRVQLNKFLQ